MPEIPHHLRRSQHRIGKTGRQSEKRLAREMEARLQPASGAMQGAKGDFTFEGTLMEAKSTTNASISIKLDWLLKIAQEARAAAQLPALTVSFVDAEGKARPNGDWAMIPLRRLQELLDAEARAGGD